MNRKEIRTYVRGLIDEFQEEPEGMVRDESADIDLNTLINISIQNVQLDIVPFIPRYFRKSKLLSTEANKGEYDIETDFGITDFLLFENIFHNISGDTPKGLLHVEPGQLHELEINVGEAGEPQCWMYEEVKKIALRPIPSGTVTDKYKAYYFRELPDLNQDEEHDPSNNKYAIPDLPKQTHILVAIDTVLQCHIIGEEEARDIEKRYTFHLSKAINSILSFQPSLGLRRRSSLGKSVR